MEHELLIKALKASEKGRSYAVATLVESTVKGTPRKAGAKMIVLEDGTLWGSIGGGRNEKAVQKECLKSIKSGNPSFVTYDYFGGVGQSVCGGQIKVFIEPFRGTKHFVICGAGHIALPLSAMAKMLGFKVTIIDNRKELANKRRFPHVDRIILGNHAQKLKTIAVPTKNDYIAIVTQGNEYDYQCLETALKTEAGYIGVISSALKKVKFFRRLKEKRVPANTLQRIHAPMGLNIGAQTPEEIAVSILSQIIAIDTEAILGSLKFAETDL